MAGKPLRRTNQRAPLGEKIAQLRKTAGLEQIDLAVFLKLSVKQYQRYEKDVEPDSDKLALLSGKFEYDLFSLVRSEAYKRNGIGKIPDSEEKPKPGEPKPDISDRLLTILEKQNDTKDPSIVEKLDYLGETLMPGLADAISSQIDDRVLRILAVIMKKPLSQIALPKPGDRTVLLGKGKDGKQGNQNGADK